MGFLLFVVRAWLGFSAAAVAAAVFDRVANVTEYVVQEQQAKNESRLSEADVSYVEQAPSYGRLRGRGLKRFGPILSLIATAVALFAACQVAFKEKPQVRNTSFETNVL